tara:strand:+ start:526 stop:1032 length:507 start_codon:yes stop_codon:yes gene_type:complete
MMYSIYHIEGVKIGVSKNVKRRMKQQGYTMKDVEVLEEHTDIYKVSDREQQLQKEYGYPVDRNPYWKIVKMAILNAKIGAPNISTQSRIKGGVTQGKHNVDSGHHAKMVAKRKRSVLQYDLNSNLIKEWECAAYAEKALGAKSMGGVVNNIAGRRKHFKGYIFKYKED